MVEYCKKYYFIKVHNSWFNYAFNPIDAFRIKAYLHLKNVKRPPPAVKSISYTVENNLDQDAEKILSGFARNLRTEIRKAQEIGITTFFHEDVDGFVRFYNAFALKKQIPLISNRRLQELGSSLRLSYALRKNEVLAAHSYMIDEDESIVRVCWGGTARLGDDVDNNTIGLANKLLHFQDMLSFKAKGIKVYDWGGYAKDATDQSLIGINNFKMKFGGQVVPCHNYETVAYILIHKLAGTMGFLGKVY